MLKNYFKIAFRNLSKHKFYAAINVFGLSLGISCCIVLFQFITYHLSFDTHHSNAKHIYRVVDEMHVPDGSVSYEKGAPMVMANAVKTQVPQVKNTAILMADRSFTVAVNNDTTNPKLFSEHENIALTDNHLFEIFDYKWEQGNPAIALTEPNTAVISAGLAKKYFGEANPMGKSLLVDNRLPVKITGVLGVAGNTDFKADMFISLASFEQLNPDFAKQMRSDWYFINSHTSIFFRLNDNASPQKVEAAIASIIQKTLGKDGSWFHFKLMPLRQWHFDGRYAGVVQKSLLLTLGLVGLLLIIIACVNFINMATAQSTKRAKEIGTRKVLGSTPLAIFYQFITETGIIAGIAVILSTGFAALFTPVLNNWLGTNLALNIFDHQLALFLLAVLLLIVLTAGFYPAFILSRFKPINALKNQVNANVNTSQFTRKGLIIAQNIIAQVLIICTLLITLQTKFLKNADPGFNKNAIVMLPLPDKAKAKTDYLRNLMLSNPGVKSISYCYEAAISTSQKGGSVKYDNRDWENFTVLSTIGDAGYAKTFGLKIIAGRDYAESDSSKQYLINEKLVKMLGAKTPDDVIGRKFTSGDLNNSEGTIVGVIKDFHSKSMYSAMMPQLISSGREYYRYAAVKLSGNDISAAINNVRNSWKSVYPEYAFEYHFLDEQIAQFYSKEELLGKLIKASTVVAILISCLGLLGLISLITTQRTKEIGIRKVLGASVAEITALISKDFLKLVLLAIVVAIPVAWITMHQWLQNFAYHIDVPVWVFIVTAVLSVFISLITTGIQTIRSAMVSPVKSLRSE
ncbi:ABC transporter permease [Mucilaginibacter lutimaris]|uniref:ABC transporter permease n=1 Tax=Mucilaginibacter lutimaris TaxID=931629 RepID=A0ABW2ZFU9_9SPHI